MAHQCPRDPEYQRKTTGCLAGSCSDDLTADPPFLRRASIAQPMGWVGYDRSGATWILPGSIPDRQTQELEWQLGRAYARL